jgi:hypothetical protein
MSQKISVAPAVAPVELALLAAMPRQQYEAECAP